MAIAILIAACGTVNKVDSEAQIARGRELYGTYCAACHGIQGEGQANWRSPDANGVYPAPPHDATGHTWHHADQLLLQIIADGGSMPNGNMPSGNMPRFAEQMDQEEMEAVLRYIKTFWGEREREFQQQVTEKWIGGG